MFCPKCGKKNEDNSLFCTWCGAGFGSVSTQSLSTSPAPQPKEVPQTVPAAEPEAAVTAVSASPSMAEQPCSVPTPGIIPQSGGEFSAHSASSPAVSVQAVPDGSANTLSFNGEIPVASAKKPEKERRYFTAAHIAICLAVAGVMAAAAGIFAGLYFSTIL